MGSTNAKMEYWDTVLHMRIWGVVLVSVLCSSL